MTATEVLRRMLDERGEVWGASDTYRLLVTSWSDASGHSWSFMEHRDGSFSKLTAYHLTPEQAIAATLGSCNCTNDCTNSERTETCHDKGTFNSWGYFTCSNCSIVIPLDAVKDAPSIGRTLPPKYCPNCGKKIVEPTTNDVDAEVGE